MEPIFSRQAQVVGWLKHDVVYDMSGQPRAFIRGRAIFDLAAQYIGFLAFGFFRDEHGDTVAFLHGASGGPATPAIRVIPEPPQTWELRALPQPRVVPQPATPSLRWSELDWNAYLVARPTQDMPRTAEPFL